MTTVAVYLTALGKLGCIVASMAVLYVLVDRTVNDRRP